jgi:two-component system OmpR family response regulator
MNNLAHPDGTAIRVLVVDDEPTLAEVLASVLRYEGWEVRTAADGASAVPRGAPGSAWRSSGPS